MKAVNRPAAWGIAGVVLVWSAVVALVDPRGDMPLNDDWNFAWATWHFAETGQFEFSRLTGMSLRAQVLYGAVWTWIFGESFEVLRASTLFLALLSMIMVERILAFCGASIHVRLIGASALGLHPVFFWSSFTYMTHVPFVFASLIAFYCHLRGLAQRRAFWMWVGAAAVVVSFFVRQTGIANVIPPLVALLLLRRSGDHPSPMLALPAIAATVGFGGLYLGTDLLAGYPGQLDVHYEGWQGGILERLSTLLYFAVRYTSLNLQYSAVFFAPLLPAALLFLRMSRTARLASLFALPLTIAIASYEFGVGHLMPYRKAGNVFANLGLGPMTLRDVWVFEYAYPVHLTRGGQIILTIATVLAAAVLTGAIVAVVRRSLRNELDPGHLAIVMGGAHMAAATALLWISGIYFDRYSLDSMWSLVILLPLAIPWTLRLRRVTSALLIAMGVVGAAATSEYLEWNRARWLAFEWLRARNVSLEQMDGGYEINQYLLGGQHGEINRGRPGMSVIDDEYIIAFNEVRGYRTIVRVRYQRWIGRDGVLHVQRRTVGFTPRFEFLE